MQQKSDVPVIIKYILDEVEICGMDDSMGHTENLEEQCQGVFATFLESANTDEKKKLFAWFVGIISDASSHYYIKDMCIEFFMQHFKEAKYLEMKLQFVKQQIPNYDNPNKIGNIRAIELEQAI